MRPMPAFTFSVEQLRSAPPEVRHWVANEIAHALGGIGVPRPAMSQTEPRQAEPMTLAACSAPQALQVFELIANDVIAARVFFELARESALNTNLPGVHALRVADVLHHVGLPGPDSLMGGLAAIDRAFRQIHGELAGSLFGFDDAGHVYLHETTQASIRRVWEELVQARAMAERQPAVEPVPRPENFVPQHVGPSEDIAAHTAHALHGGILPA
jgi:hypothetical protein